MFRVRDFMTKDPICVEPSEKISAVIDLMKFNHIHRIPVVDENDRLKGLITEGMIAGKGNNATSLSIYELNYLLSKTEVKTVMEKRPVFIQEEALMEEATDLLLTRDIGCLPVVNEDKKVVGILTQNDIFKSFLDMLGYNWQGSRLIVEMPDEKGVLADFCEVLAAHNVNIANIGVYENENGRARLLVKTKDLVTPDLKDVLKESGYILLEVENPKK